MSKKKVNKTESTEALVVPEVVVHNRGGVPMASSVDMAEYFEKRHDNILQGIDNLKLEQGFRALNFQETNYPDLQNKSTRMIWMTRDGFTLVAMGLTGAKALQFKLAYIKAFNLMEETLRSQPMLGVREVCTLNEAALSLMASCTGICRILRIPEHIAQSESAKRVKQHTGIDLSPLLLLSPAQDGIAQEEMMLEPTELARVLGLGSPQQVNKWLEDRGLQVKSSDGWMFTEKGRPYCIRHAWSKGGKSGYNIKWNVEFIKTQAGGALMLR